MSGFVSPNIVTEGLVLYLDAANSRSYPGSGSTWYDLSTVKNNGTITGATHSPSIKNGVFSFDGTNDLIDLNKTYCGAGEPLGSGSVSYTLEAWIYVETSQGSTTDADSIIGNTSNEGVGMQVGISSSAPRINYGARNTNNFYSSTFSYSTWTHVTLSRIDGVSVRGYLNGIFDTSTDSTNLTIGGSSYTDMQIGNSSTRVTGYFDGYIAMVRIYNIGLTDSQVLQNYNAHRARFFGV